MVASRKLRIDLDILKSVLAEGESTGVSTYVDIETGGVLSARDILAEEIQNRKRFIKVPSEKIWVIGKETVEKWVEDMLQIVTQNYSENFILKVGSQLKQAIEQTNYAELICTTLIDLQGEGLDDNYFASWLDFVAKEETNNIRTWLASKGIDLVN